MGGVVHHGAIHRLSLVRGGGKGVIELPRSYLDWHYRPDDIPWVLVNCGCEPSYTLLTGLHRLHYRNARYHLCD